MAQLESIRSQSLQTASELGYSTNDSLPLLDGTRIYREASDVASRLFAMLCVAACSYGFDRRKANDWLEQQGGTGLLSHAERNFLESGVGDRQQFMQQIEGMWALAWCINVVSQLDFGQPCSQDFISCFPDLKKNESGEAFREQACLRVDSDIVGQCDLAFCLHWAIVDAELQGKKLPAGAVKPYVVIERRRALEWMLTDEEWEDISLDT